MSAGLILLPEAKRDVKEAYLWYEEQSLGLGMEFLRCFENALASIQRMPKRYPMAQEICRRALMRRFPYAVFFDVDYERDCCVVYAVFHCARDPHKWRERIPEY